MVASAVRLWPFVVLFAAPSGYGQTTPRALQSLEHMHHTAWGKGDGVVSGASDRIQRSGDGYLWLAAKDGLLRFDGVRFTLIDSAIAPALRSTVAGAFTPLLVDHNHDLLVSRPDGAVVRYRDGSFQVVLGPGRPGSHSYDIEDRAGRVWVPTGGKLTILSGGRLAPVVLPPGMPDSVKTIVRDTGTGIWAGTLGAVWHVNGARGERFKVPGNSSGLYIDPLFQARDGTLWVDATELFTLKNNTWSAVRLNGRAIQARRVVEGPNHELLIATRGTGLLRVVDGRIEQMSQRDGLSSSGLMDVLVDAEGTIWMTTEAGLDRLRTTPFTTLSARDHAPFESALGMKGDASEGIWVQSSDGRVFHGRGGIVDDKSGDVTWREQRFARNETHSIIGAGRRGGVWAAEGINNRLEFGDARAGRQGPTMRLPDPRTFANIVLEDRSGSAWVVVSPGGLLRVRHGKIETIPLPARENGAPPYVSSIAEDAAGHIWAAVPPRLLELNDGKIIATLDSADNFHTAVLRAGGGDTLWAITEHGRLERLIGHSMRELDIPGARVFVRAGTPVLEVTPNDMWIGGPGGIARLSLAAVNAFADGRGPPPVPRTYGREDGLPVSRISSTNNRQGAFVARDGRVWFSTPAGPAVYDETLDRRNDVAPHPAIEEVLVDGRVIPHDSAVAIHAGADRVEIRYSAPSLRIPDRVRIEYRMERADTGWVVGNALRVAAYPQLRPGRYRFHVRAWNEDGVPSAGEAVMNVRVFPQWYESAWFMGAVLLALLSIGPLVVYIALRSRAAAREQRARERFDAALAERTRLARELHDTLLQGFTGITLKLQALQGSLLVAPQAASEALTRVLDESDVALLDARQMIWDMRLPELEEHDLADALADAARRMLADRSVELRFAVRGAKRRLAPLVESTVFRIGREAIANAAKHAEATLVEMDLAYGQQGVTLHIRDDGVGIAADVAERAAANGHLGLVGMRERAAQAGGTLAISGAPRAGTQLTLTIPVSTQA